MDDRPCRRCGSTETRIEVLASGPHYAKEACAGCGNYVRFVPRPDNGDRARRGKSHSDLVSRYSRGFCEMCEILQSRIPNREAMEAHHVIEYRNGGDKERENIWCICTRCHKLIHWLRTYLNHLIPGGQYAVDEDPQVPDREKTMDQLENDLPPW